MVSSCGNQVIWMKQTLEYLVVKYEDQILIHCDNTSAINIFKNLVMHSKTKHIPIKYHFMKEKVSQKVVKLESIDLKEQIADIFTKPLPRESFSYIRKKLGIIPHH